VVAFRIGLQTRLLLTQPDEIERVLVKEHHAFPKDRRFWEQVTAVFGNGLLTSQGALWQRQRRLTATAFTRQKLSGYANIMVSATEQTLDGWRSGEVRDLHVEMMALTLRIAARALFGSEVEDDVATMDAALDDVLGEIAARIVRPFLIPDAVPLPGHLRYRRGLRQIERIVARIIAERRRWPGSADNLLSSLMNARDEDGSAMSDQQLRDEVINFLLAGHETTALALSWSIYLLGQHPDINAKLSVEARDVLSGYSATIDDLPHLRFSEQVVTESMRLYPPAWAIGREARQNCSIGGYSVRAGTPIYISPWILHRDPRFFEEPEVFRPQRWAGDLAQRLPRFAYMPFGGGPRICIGNRFAMNEAVLILSTLVRRFGFVSQSDRSAVPFPSITLRPKGGVWVKLEERLS
jgi:cytochrome P450